MKGEIRSLRNITDIDAILVTMTNETIKYVVKKGSVTLNPKLILNEVLYVPTLDCNLILVAQLLNELYCMVTFTKRLCVA